MWRSWPVRVSCSAHLSAAVERRERGAEERRGGTERSRRRLARRGHHSATHTAHALVHRGQQMEQSAQPVSSASLAVHRSDLCAACAVLRSTLGSARFKARRPATTRTRTSSGRRVRRTRNTTAQGERAGGEEGTAPTPHPHHTAQATKTRCRRIAMGRSCGRNPIAQILVALSHDKTHSMSFASSHGSLR